MSVLRVRAPFDGQRYGSWLELWSATLDGQKPFTASNMTGSKVFTPAFGRLPAEWQNTYLITANHADPYIVFSYDTPIAWVGADGTWWVPAIGYGSMTQGHRTRVMETLVYTDREGIMRLRTTPAV